MDKSHDLSPAAAFERLTAAGETGDDVWLDVIRKMDEVYNDLLQYEVALEEKNAALEDSQQFISSVLTSMSDLLVVCSRGGVVESVNPALASMLGLEGDAVRGRNIFDLFADAESREHAARLFSEQRGTPMEDCEMRLKAANGSAIPVSMNCTPRYNGVGKMLGFVITGRPVGELRRAYHALRRAHEDLKTTQQQLVHAEKMASLGRLVAGVAHELNNPISFVYGNAVAMKRYAERLQRYLGALHGDAPGQPEAMRKELRIDRLLDDLPSLIDGMLEGAERTRDIVDALKRFSATSRNERERFDLVEVIDRAAHWVGKGVGEALEVVLDLPPRIEVEGSAGQLQQVAMNLVQNAADATADARQHRLSIRATTADGRVRIEFHDSGPGIREEHLGRVFDPFFTTKPVGQGTGLGLAISYGIVERHGGELTAGNHPRGGAVFVLTLPLASDPAP
jgi:two-component system, NtrC family, sensor histidine kinase HupT/HoxJ